MLGLAVTSSTHWESNAGSESCSRRRDLGTLYHVEDGRSWEQSSRGLHNPKASEVLESGSRRIYRRGEPPVELEMGNPFPDSKNICFGGQVFDEE